ncbi:Lysophosphatidylserine lipase ABHD12 [Varanus komodoensis]|nr:Lysophosphatidylserine lipase ABHD12 [Varanus komodoensis]
METDSPDLPGAFGLFFRLNAQSVTPKLARDFFNVLTNRAFLALSRIGSVKVLSNPFLILHSEDDMVIPVHLGRKLFEMAYNASTKKENIKFISFPPELGFGHDHISSHPDLPSILK